MADNRTIKCADCGNTFSITEEEKKWYEDKGFALPKRCKKCRRDRRKSREENNHEKAEV